MNARERREDVDVERLVRAALEHSVPAPTRLVLARINGRSPEAFADAAAAVVARRIALAAGLLLAALTFAGRDGARATEFSGAGTQDAPFLAVVAPDDSEFETKAPVETLVAELFVTEVPE